MKKKILFIVTLCIMLICMLAIAVSAESVHNASTVNYDETVTLDDGAVCNLFDEDGNALIWFRNGGVLQSIRADDTGAGEDGNYVSYVLPSAGYTSFFANVNIHIGSTKIEIRDIVVFNIMDDDINAYYTINGEYQEGNEPFTALIETFNKDNKNKNGTMALEYAYLRLDTTSLGQKAFARCTKLKYVNLDKLTQLTNIGSVSDKYNGTFNYGEVFVGCTSLFEGQILDLSKTSLTRMATGNASGGNFESVPMIGIKLPVSDKNITIGKAAFKGCTSLKTIWIGGNIAVISREAFSGTPLQTVFFVGTKAELDTITPNIETHYNQPFLHLAASNIISYNDYLELADKSGNHFVTNYTSCVYNNGDHGELSTTGPCVGKCNDCGATVVYHNDDKNLLTTVIYSNYGEVGTKTIACQNDDCTYNVTEETPALFTCRGYSAPENGKGGIAIGFTVNNVAIAEYEEITGKTLKYGVFAVLQDRLGNNDVFADDGTVADGVISAEMTNYEFAVFELKIVGFTDTQKDIELAMGAYVAVTDGKTTEYSYLQSGTPNENEKYCFVSYNDIAGIPSTDKEVE